MIGVLPCEGCLMFFLDTERRPCCINSGETNHNNRRDSALTLDELLHGCKDRSPIWKNNTECPNCGKPADPKIRACETGMNYCSDACATEHVNANTPEGGY